GLGMCNITKCCQDVCPEHIRITDNAIIPLKERVAGRYYDPVAWVGRKLFGSKPESTESNLHLGRGTSDRDVVSCARSVTHRRVRALACSSPPSAHLAPHPNLRRPIGGSGLSLKSRQPCAE
ncbi:MAG TPA: hypothetical protein VET82_08210, partial [Candidatus Eisenbacteria bacterium]|nr:hypothetical protein [Candidatus Eisenbacteria bacterium]